LGADAIWPRELAESWGGESRTTAWRHGRTDPHAADRMISRLLRRLYLICRGPRSTPYVVRFGSFELDLRSGELYSSGRKVQLQEQPFRILRLLTECPGELVSREEIRSRLWPNGTVVEFENAVNAAIKKLRIVLGDSAEEPRYIETVKRRGYRLIVPVESSATSSSDPTAEDVECPPFTPFRTWQAGKFPITACSTSLEAAAWA
jgi:DNA-binding winged helix-turn-helix (wHTH) protein